MKAAIVETKLPFNPVTIQITIESEDELQSLLNLMDLSITVPHEVKKRQANTDAGLLSNMMDSIHTQLCKLI